MTNPTVSIITATYNSSHLLKHAIRSVIDSDFQDWELIVVGDCCTDDTEATVLGFGDARISFYNLEKNSGQQATPNNFGLGKARGKYIAFLNQDDFYYPDHLGRCLSELEASRADFMVIPGINVLSSKREDFERGNYGVQLWSVHPDGHYSSNVFSVASTWFLKKSSADRLGPWKMEKDLYVTPSQEWLFRASQLGLTFHFPSRVGVLIILSGERKNSYKTKHSFEHEYFSTHLQDAELKAQLLEKAAIYAYKRNQSLLFFEPKTLVRRVMGLPLDWVLKRLGIHPSSLRYLRGWGGKGGLIKKIRKDTGLG
ncbi:glycosyltransferase family 2 protein [Algoriphagus sp. H41]|uniref:Glycosyltransferase family 2 protein n=1 Tax=Algoriphagus oliviformis TaxID=2811231 RepID=A0ABS3BYI7_9BACT|nr:glycosyltransferase family 2 protein [Algoriphagus oliviformis]MBN7809730.1 glycosyltransferase family 2 protein [Algoriphagus oliviformis]